MATPERWRVVYARPRGLRRSPRNFSSEADHFAVNFLIPAAQLEDLRELCERCKLTAKAVRAFAAEQDVAPGIVVKRLQHLGWEVPEALNGLKVLLGWAKPGTYANV